MYYFLIRKKVIKYAHVVAEHEKILQQVTAVPFITPSILQMENKFQP